MKRGRCKKCKSIYVVAGYDHGCATIECLQCGHIQYAQGRWLPARAPQPVQMLPQDAAPMSIAEVV